MPEELTIENFSEAIMSFFSGELDVQRTWFHLDNPAAKTIAERINNFIDNLTPEQYEKIDNEVHDCDLSWSWDYDDSVACLTVGWTEVMLSGV